MDGLLLIDKPSGPTSHDIAAGLRRDLGRARTGHFGTLDPLATGLLIVAVGHATRLNQFYAGRDKSYRTTARLGFATDTYDAEGTPTGTPSGSFPSRAAIEIALDAFRGEIDQVPPPYSAKKYGGTPLYRRARAGSPVTPLPVRIAVHELRLTGYEPPELDLEIRCSTGTYIRSLVHDLGAAIGCGAHVAALRRTAIGEFRVARALAWPVSSGLAADLGSLAAWIPLAELLPEWMRADLDEAGARAIRDGQSVASDRVAAGSGNPDIPASGIEREALVRVFGPDGGLVALARRSPDSGLLAPFLVFPAA
ncbi:MAG: tRNA pseudouridine(55) synthase TruB [Acidobacteriota bacterium]|nr:tRNA pseudouridine(55) synthase TruB [Acidobacteriota bacterium]